MISDENLKKKQFSLLIRIRNIIFLRKVLKGERDINNWYNWHGVAFQMFRKYKFFQWERNLLAAVIKLKRKEYPYHLKGWTENQKKYEAYFKMEGAIQDLSEVKVEDYVTQFSNESVYKGKKEFEWCSVGTYGDLLRVERVESIDKDRFVFESDNWHNLDKEHHTMFRWATKEEIAEYELEKRRRKGLKDRIEAKQKEINELYEQLNKKCKQ